MGEATPKRKHLKRRQQLAQRRAEWDAYEVRVNAQRQPVVVEAAVVPPLRKASEVRIIRGDTVEIAPAYSSAELARLVGERVPLPPEVRRLIFKRDGYRCRYCRRRKGPWHVDHVNPVALGGTNAYDNLVTACQRCNLRKGMQVWTPIPLDDMRR